MEPFISMRAGAIAAALTVYVLLYGVWDAIISDARIGQHHDLMPPDTRSEYVMSGTKALRVCVARAKFLTTVSTVGPAARWHR